MTFTLSYPPGLTLPDDAEMYVGFGDGDALPWADLPPDFAPGSSCPCDHTLMHEYARPGSYEVTLRLRSTPAAELVVAEWDTILDGATDRRCERQPG